jgi:Fe-S-cluster containining protein
MTTPNQQPATVTANIKMKVGDLQMDAKMTVPTRPTSLRMMLPLVHVLADATVALGVKAVAEAGNAVSCKKGCGACCRQLVPIAEIEARRLRDLVNAMPEPRRSQIRGRFEEARRRFEAAGLWQKMRARDQWVAGESNGFGLDYFAHGVPCPFLEDESCSIHPDRPISCREYLVTTPAENCSKPTAETIDMVPLPGKVWTALARLDRPPAGAKFLRWVPLILSLEWAEAHPEEPAERPGHEWLGELIDNLNTKRMDEG